MFGVPNPSVLCSNREFEFFNIDHTDALADDLTSLVSVSYVHQPEIPWPQVLSSCGVVSSIMDII